MGSGIAVTDVSRLMLYLVSPVFSPDGSKILGGGGSDGVEVGSIGGSDLRVIASREATSFSWSPDGTKMAVTLVQGEFTSGSQSADLVVMNADGSSPTDVGTSDFPRYVQFLPDGRLGVRA
jgi:Tol biopolymer transport system component